MSSIFDTFFKNFCKKFYTVFIGYFMGFSLYIIAPTTLSPKCLPFITDNDILYKYAH